MTGVVFGNLVYGLKFKEVKSYNDSLTEKRKRMPKKERKLLKGTDLSTLKYNPVDFEML
jgi:hypothetical protein